jgi:hypothetical protein
MHAMPTEDQLRPEIDKLWMAGAFRDIMAPDCILAITYIANKPVVLRPYKGQRKDALALLSRTHSKRSVSRIFRSSYDGM